LRFKLLAIVPTISGAAVAFLSRGRSAGELLAVGLIGLAATLGVLLYEVRNTQLYDYSVHRAKELEARLGQVSIYGSSGPGGLFTERPGRDIRVFVLAFAGHERGLAIVSGPRSPAGATSPLGRVTRSTWSSAQKIWHGASSRRDRAPHGKSSSCCGSTALRLAARRSGWSQGHHSTQQLRLDSTIELPPACGGSVPGCIRVAGRAQ
jgi:hypothetical protein